MKIYTLPEKKTWTESLNKKGSISFRNKMDKIIEYTRSGLEDTGAPSALCSGLKFHSENVWIPPRRSIFSCTNTVICKKESLSITGQKLTIIAAEADMKAGVYIVNCDRTANLVNGEVLF